MGTDSQRPSNQVSSLNPVTPVDSGGGSSSGSSTGGSGTWGRSGPPKKEELVGGKKKGRTWGPSSTLQKERAGGEERYWRLDLPHALLPDPCPPEAAEPPPIFGSPCRLKALGEGSKQWSSSAPNLGKSPKHTPMAPGFASLNEMGKKRRMLSKGNGGDIPWPKGTLTQDKAVTIPLGCGEGAGSHWARG